MACFVMLCHIITCYIMLCYVLLHFIFRYATMFFVVCCLMNRTLAASLILQFFFAFPSISNDCNHVGCVNHMNICMRD